MSSLRSFYRSGLIVMVLVLSVLAVAAFMASGQRAASVTAAPGVSVPATPRGPVTGEQATQIAQKTEKLHAAAAQRVNHEDDAPLAVSTPQPRTALSPEQAMDVVFKSGLDSSQVTSIVLTTNATGQPVYEVNVGASTGAVVVVDAQTGKIISPSTVKP